MKEHGKDTGRGEKGKKQGERDKWGGREGRKEEKGRGRKAINGETKINEGREI